MKNRTTLQRTAGFAALFFSQLANAQNPLITDQFTADPTARVFDGRVYVYPSHDILPPTEARADWFCMEDYHVFSSNNLIDWTDHGAIVSQTNVPWVDASSYSMWAPDCVEKEGKYYFYFPANTKSGGFAIGVAISDSPSGPFKPQPNPIESVHGIDPCVLIDQDGSAYLYYSLGKIFVAKLKDNMIELASEPQEIENLPTQGLLEGPFVFERNGIYYLTYPHVENKTERIEYATAKSPMGPFKPRGIIKDESPGGCWTVHHSILKYNDQWILFYHDNDLSPDDDKRRSMRADRLNFKKNGDIRKVIPTLRGVGIADATSTLQIDRYSEISDSGISISFLNEANRFDGWKTVFSEQDAWIRFNQVHFGAPELQSVQVRARSSSGGILEIRRDQKNGPVIAQVKIDKGSEWNIVTAPLRHIPDGIHNLFITQLAPQEIELDWIRFEPTANASITPWTTGAWETGRYRNLFLETGHSLEEIEARLAKTYADLFEGPNRVYFESGDDMAYVSDIKNHDARTEGLSYGMMVAVQLDKKEVFDRLWRWTKKYMQHQEGPREAYFAWSVNPETGKMNAPNSASDGELYFITDLLFAANRWGNDTGINYYAEARRILDAMWSKDGTDGIRNLINVEHKMITFVPEGRGYEFTDPSYHVPAFYEIWAEYAHDGHADFYRECARVSREYLHKACHPETGLTSDYAGFDGAPVGRWMTDFGFDSWRVPMNIAMDYVWYAKDIDWQQEYGNRIQRFLYAQGIDSFKDQFKTDGSPREKIMSAGGYTTLRHSLGLVSTVATASIMGTDATSREFIEAIWNAKLEPYEDGYFDPYYDGFLYLFSLMHLSGNYRIITPGSE